LYLSDCERSFAFVSSSIGGNTFGRDRARAE
jgi:hypothetical protein